MPGRRDGAAIGLENRAVTHRVLAVNLLLCLVSVSTFRLCSVMLRIGRFLRAARKLHLSRTRDVAQDFTGYRGYHRVSSVLGGHAAKIAFFARLVPFLAIYMPFLAI